jgi:hypothetical protein
MVSWPMNVCGASGEQPCDKPLTLFTLYERQPERTSLDIQPSFVAEFELQNLAIPLLPSTSLETH